MFTIQTTYNVRVVYNLSRDNDAKFIANVNRFCYLNDESVESNFGSIDGINKHYFTLSGKNKNDVSKFAKGLCDLILSFNDGKIL